MEQRNGMINTRKGKIKECGSNCGLQREIEGNTWHNGTNHGTHISAAKHFLQDELVN